MSDTILTVILRDEGAATVSAWALATLPYRMKLHQVKDGWLLMQWHVDDVDYRHDYGNWYVYNTHPIQAYFQEYLLLGSGLDVPADDSERAELEYNNAEDSSRGLYACTGYIESAWYVHETAFGGRDFGACPFTLRFAWNVEVTFDA